MMSDNQAEFDSTRPANGSGSGDYGGTADDAALMDLASTTPAARRPLEDAEDAPLTEAAREFDVTNPNLHLGTGGRETVRGEPERSAAPSDAGPAAEAPAWIGPAASDQTIARDWVDRQQDGEDMASSGRAGDPRAIEATSTESDPIVPSDRAEGPDTTPAQNGLPEDATDIATDLATASTPAATGAHAAMAPVHAVTDRPAVPLDDRAEARLDPLQQEPAEPTAAMPQPSTPADSPPTAVGEAAPVDPSASEASADTVNPPSDEQAEPAVASPQPDSGRPSGTDLPGSADPSPQPAPAEPPVAADPPAQPAERATPPDQADPVEPAPTDPAPPNQAPTGLNLDNATVAENAAGATVGSVQALDPNDGDKVSFSVSEDRFEVIDGQLKLKDGVSLDHEAEPTVDLEITVADAGGLSQTKAFSITVGNVNEAPTDLALDNSAVAENAPGAVIGTLSAVDPDAGDTVGYSVSDDRFEVVDGQLKLKDGISLDHEAEPTVEVDVTASDGTPGGGVRTLWSEDFADLADGVVDDTGATAWSTDDSAAIDDASHGVQDQAYEFGQSAQAGGEGLVSWQSAPIDIAGATDLTIGFDLTGRGTLDGGGRLHDHVRVFADVDGSRHELLADSGRIDGGPEFSFSGIPEGESLSIAVETQTTGKDEVYRLDNIRVDGAAAPEGMSTTKTFAIDVEDVNEAPTDLALEGGLLAGNEAGATVGRITVSDPDAGDSHEFTVAEDAPATAQATGYEVEFVSAEAGYRNTLGWYETATGEADLLFENMKALDEGTVESFQTAAADPADIGFFLIPNGYPKIRGMLGDEMDMSVDAEAGKIVLQGNGGTKSLTAWFTDESLNIDGEDHVLFVGDGGIDADLVGTYRWEDMKNLGDQDFQDAIIAVRTAQPEPAATVDDPRFEIVDGQLKLKDGVSIDPQAEPTVTVTVTADDRGGLSHSESFSLTLEEADAAQLLAMADSAPAEATETVDGRAAADQAGAEALQPEEASEVAQRGADQAAVEDADGRAAAEGSDDSDGAGDRAAVDNADAGEAADAPGDDESAGGEDLAEAEERAAPGTADDDPTEPGRVEDPETPETDGERDVEDAPSRVEGEPSAGAPEPAAPQGPAQATADPAASDGAEAGGGSDLILIDGLGGSDAPGDWTAEPAADAANGEGLDYVNLAESASSHVVMTEGNDLGLDGLERVEW